MKTSGASRRTGAFSLIELLCVMLIIALLAALVLPALNQAKLRARRVQCVHQLHQAGVAFQGFAHDHNSQFPMAVPASAGGSLEFVQNAYRIEGEFYFAFRHFQAVSNELVTPKVIVCPSDTRRAAETFASLKNDNVSYFIGVKAEYGRPNSILAGDRNVTNDWIQPATMLHLDANSALRWTHELHRFKGNLLFADGRVEERNSPALTPPRDQFPARADLALPTAQSPGHTSPAQFGGSGIPAPSSSPNTPSQPGSTPAPSLASGEPAAVAPDQTASPEGTSPAETSPTNSSKVTSTGKALSLPSAIGSEMPSSNAPPKKNEKLAPRVSGNGPSSQKPEEDWTFSPFAQWFGAIAENMTRKGAWLLYGLLLLVALATVRVRKWSRSKSKTAKRR